MTEIHNGVRCQFAFNLHLNESKRISIYINLPK